MILKLIEKLNICNGELKITDKEIKTIRTALRIYNGIEDALDEELGIKNYKVISKVVEKMETD